MSNVTFKSFGAKNFAKGAARKLLQAAGLEEGDINNLLVQVDGKWGFYLNETDNVPVGAPVQEEPAQPEPEPQVAEQEAGEPQPTGENAFAGMGTANNPFGAMVSSMQAGTQPQAAAPVRKAGGYTIQKDRPEQNGIKMPSEGTTCRLIWDTLDSLSSELGSVPPIKLFKEVASKMDIDPTTTTIQYYKWRNFHGVSGRLATPKEQDTPPIVD